MVLEGCLEREMSMRSSLLRCLKKDSFVAAHRETLSVVRAILTPILIAHLRYRFLHVHLLLLLLLISFSWYLRVDSSGIVLVVVGSRLVVVLLFVGLLRLSIHVSIVLRTADLQVGHLVGYRGVTSLVLSLAHVG